MKICIQNLGMYNEGVLLWHWLELPATEDDIQNALDAIRVCNEKNDYYNDCGCPYEELMIADWENIPFDISEYSNINELNELAEQYEALDDTQKEAFEAFRESYSDTDALEKAATGDYYYIEAENDTDLAYEYIAQTLGDIAQLGRETLERYFDYEAFGRDLAYDFTQTSNGYISNY